MTIWLELGAHISALVFPRISPVIANCGSSLLLLSGVAGSACTVKGPVLWIGYDFVISAALPPEPEEEADSGGGAECCRRGIAKEFAGAVRREVQSIGAR